MTNVNQRTFAKEVLDARVPVLVDFYASWCGPCRTIAPLLEELATEFAGRVRIVKVNVDESPELARRFGIDGVPALLFFVAGQEVGRTVGVPGAAALRRALDQLAGARTSAR